MRQREWYPGVQENEMILSQVKESSGPGQAEVAGRNKIVGLKTCLPKLIALSAVCLIPMLKPLRL